MHNHTLHRGKKHFCNYCLQSFCTERHIKDCFKINSKQRLICPKNVNTLKSKILKEK